MTVLPSDAIEPRKDSAHDLLLYDYFKHMTSMSLVTLGGILSIPQISDSSVTIRDVLPSILLIIASGAAALYGMEAIIKASEKALALTKWHRLHRTITSVTFGLGVGAFLAALT